MERRAADLESPLLEAAKAKTPKARTPQAFAAASERASSSKRHSAIFVPYQLASAEASSYPHDPYCRHCHSMLLAREARWGSGLCDPCYTKVVKDCTECGSHLALKQVRFTQAWHATAWTAWS